MATENQITVVGNLADDPELRYTPSGTAVTNIRVAVNRRRRDAQSGEWVDELDGFFTCNVWRDMAENVAESLTKGVRVLVTGRLRSRSYEDRQGETRWVTEIEADEICPSLRWATAEISKVNRSGGAGGKASNGGGTQSPPPASEPPTPDDVPF